MNTDAQLPQAGTHKDTDCPLLRAGLDLIMGSARSSVSSYTCLWQRPGCRLRSLAFVCCVVLLLGISGCASATTMGLNPGLDGTDLQAMTEQMAQSLGSDPEVRRAATEQGSLRVVVMPVQNYMTGEVLPEGQKKAFVGRLRGLLQQQTPQTFTWIANKDTYQWVRANELEGIDPGPDPDAIQPRYALQGRFDSLTNVSAMVRSISYLCVFELMDLETREILWADTFELKKTAVRGFLD